MAEPLPSCLCVESVLLVWEPGRSVPGPARRPQSHRVGHGLQAPSHCAHPIDVWGVRRQPYGGRGAGQAWASTCRPPDHVGSRPPSPDASGHGACVAGSWQAVGAGTPPALEAAEAGAASSLAGGLWEGRPWPVLPAGSAPQETSDKSVIELQQFARKNKPNLHILSKLQEEMRRLAEERVCGGPKPLGAATLTLLLGRASQLMPRKHQCVVLCAGLAPSPGPHCAWAAVPVAPLDLSVLPGGDAQEAQDVHCGICTARRRAPVHRGRVRRLAQGCQRTGDLPTHPAAQASGPCPRHTPDGRPHSSPGGHLQSGRLCPGLYPPAAQADMDSWEIAVRLWSCGQTLKVFMNFVCNVH